MSQTGIPIFKAWLVFVVLATVLGFVAGAVAGFFIGFVMGASGQHDVEEIQMVCSIAGFIAGLAASFLVFQWVINRFIVPNVRPR